MIVLDASCCIALLRGEPGAPRVRALLSSEEPVVMTSLGCAESVDHLHRRMRVDLDEALLDLEDLGLAPALVIDEALGFRAGILRGEHYDPKERPISLADCVLIASAERLGATVASCDHDLLEVAHRLGLRTEPIANSAGSTWRAQPPR